MAIDFQNEADIVKWATMPLHERKPHRKYTSLEDAREDLREALSLPDVERVNTILDQLAKANIKVPQQLLTYIVNSSLATHMSPKLADSVLNLDGFKPDIVTMSSVMKIYLVDKSHQGFTKAFTAFQQMRRKIDQP
eukprot:jgi/Hompol1/3655/HPOL_006701-RA